MGKPLSRSACVGIAAGLAIYGAVVLGTIGAGVGGLVDSVRTAYGSYAFNFPTNQASYSKNRFPVGVEKKLVFTSAGAKMGAGLGALLFGVTGIAATSLVRAIGQNKANVG